MRASIGESFDRVRQPEYTGENRCIPCTIVNIVIAVLLAIGAAVVWPLFGAVVLVLSGLAIYLRGYLVPGTPTLTKRYLPQRVLAWFDKAAVSETSAEQRDLEQTLLSWGIIQPCWTEDDLCLTSRYQERFAEAQVEFRGSTFDAKTVAPLFDLDPSAVTVSDTDPPVVKVNDRVNRWPSQAALIADLAMASVLDESVDAWADTSVDRRGRILAGLRPFLEACPACDGPIVIGEDVVKSCCGSRDVVRMHCEECQATIFEINAHVVPD